MAALNLDVSNFGTSFANAMQVRTIGNSESNGYTDGLSIYAGSQQKLTVTVGTTYSIAVSGHFAQSISGDAFYSSANVVRNALGNLSESVSGNLLAKSSGSYSVGSTLANVDVSAGTTINISGQNTNIVSSGALSLNSASQSVSTSGDLSENLGGSKSVVVGATFNQTVTNACSIASTGQMVLSSSSYWSASAVGSASVSAGSTLGLSAGTSAELKALDGALLLSSTGGALTVAAAGGNLKLDSYSSTIDIGTEAVNQNINIGTAGLRTISIGTTGSSVSMVANLDLGGDLTIQGNLNIVGKTNELNMEQLLVADHRLRLNEGANSDITATDGGIILAGTTDHSWLWKQSLGVAGSGLWTSNDSSVNVPSGQNYQINNKLALSNSQLAVATNTDANSGIYMAGPDSIDTPAVGQWRMRQDANGGSPVLVFEKYDGSAWQTRFRMN